MTGEVELGFGAGAAGTAGRLLARTMGLPPEPGRHAFTVDISHSSNALVWARRFAPPGQAVLDMVSRFEPVGQWPQGHWVERTGALQFRLTVDVREGGWYWRALGARWHGIPLPVKLLPRSHAHKRIENGAYRFEVAFTAPLLGPLLWYRGLLRPAT